jgi:hypothetical protein
VIAALRSKTALTAAIHRGGRIVLVVNTRSRKGRRHYRGLPARLAAAGVPLQAVFPVDDPTLLAQTLTDALALAPDLLIFGGGDGSLTAAAGRLADRDTALGVLPLGTTNNFARSLGLPLDLPGAIATLANGKVADVDLARAGEDVFANMASLGLSVQVAQAVPASLKRVLGRGAYTLTAARRLPTHRPFKATLTIDGERHVLRSRRLRGAALPPRASTQRAACSSAHAAARGAFPGLSLTLRPEEDAGFLPWRDGTGQPRCYGAAEGLMLRGPVERSDMPTLKDLTDRCGDLVASDDLSFTVAEG